MTLSCRTWSRNCSADKSRCSCSRTSRSAASEPIEVLDVRQREAMAGQSRQLRFGGLGTPLDGLLLGHQDSFPIQASAQLLGLGKLTAQALLFRSLAKSGRLAFFHLPGQFLSLLLGSRTTRPGPSPDH